VPSLFLDVTTTTAAVTQTTTTPSPTPGQVIEAVRLVVWILFLVEMAYITRFLRLWRGVQTVGEQCEAESPNRTPGNS